MIRLPALLRLLGVLPWLAAAHAADGGWDEKLAHAMSARLKHIERELADAMPGLQGLPTIPIADQGGTGGWAGVHATASPASAGRYAVEIRWPVPAAVDWLAMVPARRYDARGLDAQYGMPDAFTVELIDELGASVAVIARERRCHAHPVRNGHPFVYRLPQPVTAAGVRIMADTLLPDSEDADSYVHAWAEVFAFAGNRDLTRRAEVRGINGS